ncbi:MAG TPA: OmpA family protein [Thermoanaerobaculia bacterium]|jgi:flagellar motor protein MotB|nr:OmpA family protein [Thermoanaerobaculia bacterium]
MRKVNPEPESAEPNIWPVVADVFIGFLVLILVAILASYAELTNKTGFGTRNPPRKRDEFRAKFLYDFASREEEESKPQSPKACIEGFAEVRLYFPSDFLFQPCEIRLEAKGLDMIDRLKALLEVFDPDIDRIQVTGHTDSDPPSRESKSRCLAQGIQTNWQLSARRAITVVERLVPEHQAGIDPKKIWATARSSYEPVRCGMFSDKLSSDEIKRRARRIEVWIKFKEN